MSLIRFAAVLVVALFTAQGVANAQLPADLPKLNLAPTDTLPRDPAGIVGELDNGLKYYIRRNTVPEGRAEFRLVVKAGSLVEDDDQRGLAHWAEHMAFNGTKNYPKNELIHYLQSIGVKFGADLNAFTSFDRTVYVLPIPTDNPENINKAIDILEDWAHRITFDSIDFEEERGVIQAEMRARRDVRARLGEQQYPYLFRGSRYADRLPIGTSESLANATLEQITRFYKTWYRPDIMAIIAVGDFDEANVEQLIRDQFSAMKKPDTPVPPLEFPIPLKPGVEIAVFRDPEVTGTSVQIINRQPVRESGTVRSQRVGLIRGIVAGLLNGRIAEKVRQQGTKFIGAQVAYGSLGKNAPTSQLVVSTPTNGIEAGLQDALNEINRAVVGGFTQAELDRVVRGTLNSYETFYSKRNDRQSSAFVEGYTNEFFTNIPIASAEVQVQVMQEALTSITLDDINEAVQEWDKTDERLIFITIPQREGVEEPDTAAILAIIDADRMQGSYEAYTENVDTLPLIENLPPPGKVVSEKVYEDTQITEWELSNGIRVLVKPTKLKANEVIFRGFSRGGTSLIPDSEYPTAAFLGTVAGIGGVGRFTPSELGRKLAGHSVRVGLTIGGSTQTVQGNSTTRDMGKMLELIHLQFTAPRFDSSAIEVQIARAKESMKNRDANPGAAFNDTVQLTMSQGHPRTVITTPELLDSFDRKRAFELYKDRIADAGAFTYMFVGDFDPDSLKPLVEQYLATLPSLNRNEQARDVGIRKPTGVVQKTVYAGIEDKATTVIAFHGGYAPTKTSALEMGIMSTILEARLRDKLREEMGATYGVSVRSSVSTRPVAEYVININFTVQPSRFDEAVAATRAVIDEFKNSYPTELELKEAVEPALKSREVARQSNGFWLGALTLREQNKEFSQLFDDSALKSITPEDINAIARRYLYWDNYAQFTLMPAKENPNAK